MRANPVPWGTVPAPQRFPDLESPAPPFKINPSAWDQRVPVAVLALVGFLISGYLALYQWGLIDSVWDPVFGGGTERVLSSDLSKSMHKYMRMPDAALGALAYLGDAIFGMAGSTRRWQYRPWMVLIFGFDVIPLGVVSAVLVVSQGAIVGSWCFLCLVSAAISLILIYFAYDEVWASLKYLAGIHRESGGDRRELWAALIGRPTDLAHRLAEKQRVAMEEKESA